MSAQLAWEEDKYYLGVDAVDQQHQEFVSLLKDIEKARAPDFVLLFNALCEHIAAHFEVEDQLMEQYQFPAKAEHRGEHQRVLGELVQLSRQVEKGRTAMAMAYVKERMPDWFALHVVTMDSALAAHVNK